MASEDALLYDAISALLPGGGQGGTLVEVEVGLREYPLQIVPALQSCSRIIYATKIDWLVRLTDGFTNIPDDVAILWRFAPLSGRHRALVRAVVQSFDAPLYFVGDLDPLDLVTYATLREPTDSPLATTNYLGISDSWVERCERDLASQGKSIDTVCIPMGAEEKDGFERLKQVPTDWVSLMGPRASSMLGSGIKLELEGASNPRIYSSAFCDELLRFIFR